MPYASIDAEAGDTHFEKNEDRSEIKLHGIPSFAFHFYALKRSVHFATCTR
jgi:hypothetical protein